MPVPPARRSLLQLVVLDSNPFYLISASFMLAGCLALTNSLSWWSMPTSRLLLLFVTLNFYEAALIGLAAYLVLVRGICRDGFMLVVLEAFFLFDVTFLSAEISTHRTWMGPALAAFTLAVAAVKLLAVLRIIGARNAAAQFAFIVIELAAILALPLVFSRSAGGTVSPLMFYLAWWIVGLMPAVYEYVRRSVPGQNSPPVLVLYMVLPWMSLAAHLGILHYVYDVPFYGAMAAPALLALAMVLTYGLPEKVMPRKDVATLRALLPLSSIFVSISSPAELTIFLGHGGHLAISTAQLASAMAYLEFMYSFFRPYWIFTTLGGLLAALANLLGPSFSQMSAFAEMFWNRALDIFWSVVPTTQAAWGGLFVVLAFLFLGVGASISIWRRPGPVPAPSLSAPPLPAPVLPADE